MVRHPAAMLRITHTALPGWGRRGFQFPTDVHPDMGVDALDLIGAGGDAIVAWASYEVWIYTKGQSNILPPLPAETQRTVELFE